MRHWVIWGSGDWFDETLDGDTIKIGVDSPMAKRVITLRQMPNGDFEIIGQRDIMECPDSGGYYVDQ